MSAGERFITVSCFSDSGVYRNVVQSDQLLITHYSSKPLHQKKKAALIKRQLSKKTNISLPYCFGFTTGALPAEAGL